MKLAVLIINFRTPDLTLQCLASLVGQLRKIGDAQATVLDNGSGDRSKDIIRQAVTRKKWQDVVTLITSPENLGFAGGNNLALRQTADAEYYLILNSDTVVNAGCLQYCLRQMEQSPRTGAMSCRLNHPDGTPQVTARKFPSPLTEIFNATHLALRLPRIFGWADIQDPSWDRATVICDVDWICGAFMFVRGDLVRKIGLFDEDFFYYGEDLDLCHRIYRAGYRIRYDPTVSVIHLVGGSSGPDIVDPARRDALLLEARYKAARKCHGPIGLGIIWCTDTLAIGMRRLFSCRKGQGRSDRFPVLPYPPDR